MNVARDSFKRITSVPLNTLVRAEGPKSKPQKGKIKMSENDFVCWTLPPWILLRWGRGCVKIEFCLALF